MTLRIVRVGSTNGLVTYYLEAATRRQLQRDTGMALAVHCSVTVPTAPTTDEYRRAILLVLLQGGEVPSSVDVVSTHGGEVHDRWDFFPGAATGSVGAGPTD